MSIKDGAKRSGSCASAQWVITLCDRIVTEIPIYMSFGLHVRHTSITLTWTWSLVQVSSGFFVIFEICSDRVIGLERIEVWFAWLCMRQLLVVQSVLQRGMVLFLTHMIKYTNWGGGTEKLHQDLRSIKYVFSPDWLDIRNHELKEWYRHHILMTSGQLFELYWSLRISYSTVNDADDATCWDDGCRRLQHVD